MISCMDRMDNDSVVVSQLQVDGVASSSHPRVVAGCPTVVSEGIRRGVEVILHYCPLSPLIA